MHALEARFSLRSLRAAAALFFLVSGAACGGVEDSASESQDSIVGGTEGGPAAVGVTEFKIGNTTFTCSGTLITPKVFLTAAHCVAGATNHRVAFGERRGAFGTIYTARKVAAHPGFIPQFLQNGHDVAVVILSEAVAIAPIPFRSRPLAASDIGRPVTSVGFGLTAANQPDSVLVKRQVTTQLNSISAGTISVGRAGATTCQGDSGGPHLMGGEVIGVTSFGPDPCEAGASFESRVDVDASWIAAQILFADF